MALKTFNIDEEVYNEYSKHCKKEGISMSKQVEKFIAEEVAQIPSKSRKLEINDKIIKNDHSMRRYC